MDRNSNTYKDFCKILEEELIPAQGCTEPISLALCAARCREILGEEVQTVRIEASGSIIKNVKSVIVPNTGNQRGMQAAAAAGIVAGDPSKQLECIAEAGEKDADIIKKFISEKEFEILPLRKGASFDMVITLKGQKHTARVRIANFHTNIVLEELDGKTLLKKKIYDDDNTDMADRKNLNIQNIWDFINTLEIEDVYEVLHRQVEYNMAIAREGIKNDWGANIGSSLLAAGGYSDTRVVAKAYAAAGSDARMNGCELPVVCNSGSGNQGMTCSIPVIVFARRCCMSDDKMYRALALSNLCAIHQKDGIGRLSAYCGAVSAAAGAGAGIAYLLTGDYDAVIHSLMASLAVTSGMVCDGAKASCSSKIAVSLESAFMAHDMYANGNNFYAGDGLVTENIEDFINNIAHLGKEGMHQTNTEIIKMMTQN